MHERLNTDDIGESDTAYEPFQEHETDGSSWDACQDLDKFLADVYRYYESKGFSGTVAVEALNCIALLFTVVFSFTLVFLVNWHALSTCHQDTEGSRCQDIKFFYEHPFKDLRWYHYIFMLYFLFFLIFCLISAWRAVTEIRTAADMRSFYQYNLGVFDVAETSWAEILQKLSKRQEVAPFCIKQDSLSPLEITNILMRQDNFLIALVNHSALFTGLQRWIPKRFLVSKSVMYFLRLVIFRTIFDQHHARIVQSVVDDPSLLQRKFRFWGALVLFSIGPVIVFVAFYFFMRHAEDFRSGRSFPFERQWTPYAEWMFREYNELPHNFHGRLRRARQEAKLLITHATTPSPLLDAFRRCVKYIAGSLLAVLVVLAIIDDTSLLSVQIFNKTLWWYVAFFGVLVAWSADGDSEAAPDVEANYIETVWRTAQHSHYFPREYERTEMSRKMFHTICQEYKDTFLCPRVQMLIEEMVCVIACPFFLLFHFPHTAPAICDVIRSTHYSSMALGDWCCLGNMKVSENDIENLRVQNFGKGPKSLINFLSVHREASESLDIPQESLSFLHQMERTVTDDGPFDRGLIRLTPMVEVHEETGQVTLCHRNFKLRPRQDEIWHFSAPHFYWLDAMISQRYEETFLNDNYEFATRSPGWDVLDANTQRASRRRFEPFDVEHPPNRSNRSCIIT
eukprot:GEMP01008315.1.p1 GENE.GEMP01008315.1~~GEMP01008315.1.p1  ORF type:complete len:680 (-),score=62.29 GEMP01008315.1:1326-3365(-)